MKVSTAEDNCAQSYFGHSEKYMAFEFRKTFFLFFELGPSHSCYSVGMPSAYIRFNEEGRIFCLLREEWID